MQHLEGDDSRGLAPRLGLVHGTKSAFTERGEDSKHLARREWCGHGIQDGMAESGAAATAPRPKPVTNNTSKPTNRVFADRLALRRSS